MRALGLAGLLALTTPADAWGGVLQFDVASPVDLVGLDRSTDAVLHGGEEPLDDPNSEGSAAAARFASRLRLAQDKTVQPDEEPPAAPAEAQLRLPTLEESAEAAPDAPPRRLVDPTATHVAADDDPLQAVERGIEEDDLATKPHLVAVEATLAASRPSKARTPDALPTQDRGGALADLASSFKKQSKIAKNITSDEDLERLNDFDADDEDPAPAAAPAPDMGKASDAEAAAQAKFDKEEAVERALDADPDTAPVGPEAAGDKDVDGDAEDVEDGLRGVANALQKGIDRRNQNKKAAEFRAAYRAKQAAKPAAEATKQAAKQAAEPAKEAAQPAGKALRRAGDKAA